jgi:hypothetical protein
VGNVNTANDYHALKNKARSRPALARGEGGQLERRLIRRPEGVLVEEFVDPSGNVVWIQLIQLGTNQTREHADMKRGQLRRDGFVEYAKCPCRSGARFATPGLETEFAVMPDKLQKPCVDDPVVSEVKGGIVHLKEPCPHIAWLIHDRRERHAEAQALRASQMPSITDLEQQKLAVAEQQLAAQQQTNQRILEILEKGSKKG